MRGRWFFARAWHNMARRAWHSTHGTGRMYRIMGATNPKFEIHAMHAIKTRSACESPYQSKPADSCSRGPSAAGGQRQLQQLLPLCPPRRPPPLAAAAVAAQPAAGSRRPSCSLLQPRSLCGSLVAVADRPTNGQLVTQGDNRQIDKQTRRKRGGGGRERERRECRTARRRAFSRASAFSCAIRVFAAACSSTMAA